MVKDVPELGKDMSQANRGHGADSSGSSSGECTARKGRVLESDAVAMNCRAFLPKAAIAAMEAMIHMMKPNLRIARSAVSGPPRDVGDEESRRPASRAPAGTAAAALVETCRHRYMFRVLKTRESGQDGNGSGRRIGVNVGDPVSL